MMGLEEMRVLVVEDNPQSKALMKKMLRELGINQIYTANDGKDALDFMGSCEDMYDLILCDWKMPRMSGLELLQQVRSTDSDIPFLMVTGTADRDSVVEAQNSGVTSYIVKPFSGEQLEKKLRAIARMLQHRMPAA